ncbi:glycoside hydrolase superfamily [Trametes punicea]|nr:glycoside hydrolase superfamily [Trametes punicea]
MSPLRLASALSALCLIALQVAAYDNSRSDNLAVYWGQNSYGATHTNDVANWQQSIGYYCQDDSIDAIPIAFLNIFQSTGGYPSINLANTCNTDDNGVFPGTSLPNCTFLASDIEFCQSRGKIVTISLGGATGSATFSSADQATAFGDTIWNLFLGGSSSLRPFGGAVLDGVDLDIEGGNTQYFDSFLARIRQLAAAAGGKQYYVTGAPQCPYPDGYLGTVLNLASFDAVYVQFYNNWCGLQNYDNIWAWDFSSWDNWAKTLSVNPNVKIYIGAPASSTAAGSGYVDATTLANIALQQRANYSSFGGVMLWDASQAYANNRYDAQIKNAIRIGSGGATSSSPTTAATTGGTSSTSSTGATTTTTKATSTTTKASTTTKSTTTSTSVLHHEGNLDHESILDHEGGFDHPEDDYDFSHVYVYEQRLPRSQRMELNHHDSQGTNEFDSQYVGGNRVTYNGHLWTAKWWTYNDVPGGPAGVWADNGPC